MSPGPIARSGVTNVAVDRALTLSQQDATRGGGRGRRDGACPLGCRSGGPGSRPCSPTRPIGSRSISRTREPLLTIPPRAWIPHLLSTEGPALAIGDIDGDGRDDIYVGGAKWQAGRLFIQRPTAASAPARKRAFQLDSLSEDVRRGLLSTPTATAGRICTW